jgi:hypothetical protein
MSDHASARHTHCQNCGTPLAGPYCSVCGQHDVDYHRSLWPMLEDALEGFFHFDGKVFKSVRYLFTRPGFLTQEFVAGRRASYANPLRLYIFISFLFFAAQALLAHRPTREEKAALAQQVKGATQGAAQAVTEAAQESPEVRKKIEALKERGVPAAATPSPTPTPGGVRVKFAPKVDPDVQSVQIQLLTDPDNQSPISRYLRERLGPNGTLDPRALKGEIAHLLPAMFFLCLPLLALVLRVVYKGSHRFYIEHLVYALHLQAFLFLASLVTQIVRALIGLLSANAASLAETVLFLGTAWLIYGAFRRFYGQGRWKTALKLGLVAGAYGVILLLGIVAVWVGSFVVVLREA